MQEIFLLITGIGIGCLFQPPLIGLQAAMPLKDLATSTATFGLIRYVHSVYDFISWICILINLNHLELLEALLESQLEIRSCLIRSSANSPQFPDLRVLVCLLLPQVTLPPFRISSRWLSGKKSFMLTPAVLLPSGSSQRPSRSSVYCLVRNLIDNFRNIESS